MNQIRFGILLFCLFMSFSLSALAQEESETPVDEMSLEEAEKLLTESDDFIDEPVSQEISSEAGNDVVETASNEDISLEEAEALLNEPENESEKISPFYIPKTETQTTKRYKRTKFHFSAGLVGTFHFDTFVGEEMGYTNIFGGTAGVLRFGLNDNENDFMWSIEQQFGAIWGLRIQSGSKKMSRLDGASMVEFSYFTKLSKNWKGQLIIGAGFLYNLPKTGKEKAYGDFLAVDNKGTNLAVGYKLGVNCIYFFTPTIGLGLELSYVMGVDIGSYWEGEFADRNGEKSNPDMVLMEILQPGISYFMKF